MQKLPLQLLLNRWEQEVRPLEPSTQILIQEILYNYGQNWMLGGNIDEIRKAIGPVLARNEEEQELFTSLFNKEFIPAVRAFSREEFEENPIQEIDKEEDFEKRIQKDIKKDRIWAYALMIVLFLFVRYSIFTSQLPDANLDEEQPLTEEILSAEEFPDPNEVQIGAIASINKQANVPQSCSQLPTNAKLSIYPSYAPLDIRRKAIITPDVAVRDPYFTDMSTANIPGNPFNDDNNPTNSNTHLNGQRTAVFDQAGIYAFEIDVKNYFQDGEGLNEIGEGSSLEKILFVPVFNPDAQEYRDFHLGIMTDQQNWMKVKVFGLLILLFLFTEGGLNLWKNRKRKLAFRMEFGGNEDGTYEIPFEEIDKKMQVDPKVADLAVQLSLRRKSHLQKLNLPETIRETVASAGMPQFVYETQFKASEYIALMEDDGKLPLYQEFVRQLTKQDVPVKAFVYDIDKALVFDQKHPEGLPLNKLNYLLPHSQLIIFSNGYRLLDPVSAELKQQWKEELDLWEDRILISPVLAELWSGTEEALSRHFQLLPLYSAQKDGKWEIDRAPQFLDKKEGTGYDFSKPADVKAYLGEEIYAWLSGSMLHNKPKYEVLLAVGHAMAAKKADDFVASGNFILEVPRQEFVSLSNLAKIYSLPWMKEEDIPEGLRKAMLDELDAETEMLARKAIVAELQRVDAEEGSPVYAEKNTQLTIHQSRLNPESKLLQRKLRYLWMEDKLEEEEKEAVHFQHALQRLQMTFPLRQSLLAIAFAGFLAFMGVNYLQNQPSRLVDKYLAEDTSNTPMLHSSILRESNSLDVAWDGHPFSYFESIPKLIEEGEIRESIDQIFELKEMIKPHTFGSNPEILLLLDWYEALTVLKTGNLEKTNMILDRIEKSGNKYFQQRVFLLKWDLQKPWYQIPLPVKEYLTLGQ